MRSFAAGCFASIGLLACSTGAQLEVERHNKILADLTPALDACTIKLQENPRYAGLVKKMSVRNEYSLQMLADPSKPSKDEITLLYSLHADTQQCRKIALDAASRSHPLRLVVFVELYSAHDQVWAEAVSGKLTRGQFNQARKAISEGAASKMAQADAQINSSLAQSHDQEIAQRQRAAAAFQQWNNQQQAMAQQQQAINAINRPRTINCNYVGNSANCNSY